MKEAVGKTIRMIGGDAESLTVVASDATGLLLCCFLITTVYRGVAAVVNRGDGWLRSGGCRSCSGGGCRRQNDDSDSNGCNRDDITDWW